MKRISLSKRNSDSLCCNTSGEGGLLCGHGGGCRGRRRTHLEPRPFLSLFTALYLVRWHKKVKTALKLYCASNIKGHKGEHKSAAPRSVCACVGARCACLSGSLSTPHGLASFWHQALVCGTPERLCVPCWHSGIVFFYPLTKDKWPRYCAY